MEIGIIVAVVIVIAMLSANTAKAKKQTPVKQNQKETQDAFDYTKGYQQKWMFTYNEKDAFSKIKAITDEMGLFIFAKVRLYDLIEPKKGIENYKGHQGKIQSKHVDFVVCNQKLVAKLIIELDDASHDEKERAERDKFVDTVLTGCGYKIIHIRAVDTEKLKHDLESIFNPLCADAQ